MKNKQLNSSRLNFMSAAKYMEAEEWLLVDQSQGFTLNQTTIFWALLTFLSESISLNDFKTRTELNIVRRFHLNAKSLVFELQFWVNFRNNENGKIHRASFLATRHSSTSENHCWHNLFSTQRFCFSFFSSILTGNFFNNIL